MVYIYQILIFFAAPQLTIKGTIIEKSTSIILITLLAVNGCASDLVVTDTDGTSELPGIPVQAPLLVAVETTTSYKPLGTPPQGCDLLLYCADRISSQAKFLPLGKTYYVGFDSAALAKSEFSLTFAESGVLTGVSLNSTPSVEPFTGLLDTVLPFLAAPKVATGEPNQSAPLVGPATCPRPAKEVFEKHCIKAASKVTNVEEIDIKFKDD